MTNPDGSTDLYFGLSSPGEGKNWLRALPDKGFFVILRLYGPTKDILRSDLEARRYREATLNKTTPQMLSVSPRQ